MDFANLINAFPVSYTELFSYVDRDTVRKILKELVPEEVSQIRRRRLKQRVYRCKVSLSALYTMSNK